MQLPENVNDYAHTAKFMEVSGTYKIDEIKAKLDELGVAYQTSDNKTALIYRWLLTTDELPDLVEVEEYEPDYDEDYEPVEVNQADVNSEAASPMQAVANTAPDQGVVVTSHHYRSLLEPATGTLIPPRTKTVIMPTAHVTRERIINNLTQIARLHGDLISIGGEDD